MIFNLLYYFSGRKNDCNLLLCLSIKQLNTRLTFSGGEAIARLPTPGGGPGPSN